MSNVTHLVDHRKDGRVVTPAEILDLAQREHAEGQLPATRALLIFLDESDPSLYAVKFRNAGLSTSEMLALVVRYQHIVNKMMDGEL